MTGLMLVASDGSEASGAAVAMAARLAAARGLVPEVVSVLPRGGTSTAMTYALPPMSGLELDAARRHRRLQEIARLVAASAGASARWPVSLASGDPARAVCELAEQRRAALLVTGLVPHGTVDRVLGEETALDIMRRAGTPVLSVLPTLASLPRRVVVAIDFSRASLRSARAVLGVLAPDARVLLVHVRPDDAPADDPGEGYGVIYSHGVVGAFARLRRELRLPASMRSDTIFLQGEPAPELLALAHRAEADLIAVGSHRHGLLDRLRLGSVTAQLARSARCSMFVAPPGSQQR